MKIDDFDFDLPSSAIAQRPTDPRDAARLYHECAHDLGRARLADLEGLEGFIDAVSQIIDAVEGA